MSKRHVTMLDFLTQNKKKKNCEDDDEISCSNATNKVDPNISDISYIQDESENDDDSDYNKSDADDQYDVMDDKQTEELTIEQHSASTSTALRKPPGKILH